MGAAKNADHQKSLKPWFKDGDDFLFLFDLLSHYCGIESTLRVLTNSDIQFHDIFRPNFNFESLLLEEDRLKVR